MSSRLDFSYGQMTLLNTNLRERKRLEGHIKELHSSTKFRMNKIDREMMVLKKQLEENRKVYGTHCDISRENDQNEAQLKITKVVTRTPSSLSVSRRPSTVRAGRRHSIASPMEMNRFNEKPRQISLEIPRQLLASNNAPTRTKERPRRHSIASPSNEMTINYTPSVNNNNSKDDNTKDERPPESFSVVRKKCPNFSSSFTGKGLQCPGQQNSNNAAPQNPQTRVFARRTNYTIVFGDGEQVDENNNKKTSHSSRANGEKLAEISTKRSTDVPSKKTFFQRRKSLPNLFLHENSSVFKTSNKTEKLTAKLPTRIASATTRGQPQQQQTTRRPTPVEEKSESDDENNDDEHKSKSESKKDDESSDEENNKDDDDEVECLSEDDGTVPRELRILPKITLEEKIQKYFAGTVVDGVQSVKPGHFEEVLEQFKTKKDNEINTEN